jgi:hypothetical protein
LDQKNGEKVLNFIASLFSPLSKELNGWLGPSLASKDDGWRSQRPRSESESHRPPLALRKNTGSAQNNVYRLSISCSNINNPNNKLIKDYFSNFKLKTSKQKSFFIWVEILDYCLNNRHLEEEKINELRKLAKKMNKFTIDNNPIGSSKFS